MKKENKSKNTKKITAELDAFYGYGCGGCSYGSDNTVEIKVSDKVASTLSALMEAKGQEDGDCDGLSNEYIEAAIEAGHTELKPLDDDLSHRLWEMIAHYWVFEADLDGMYDDLREHFDQDVEDGLYVPVADEEEDDEFDDDEEEDDGENDGELTFDDCRENYRAWVFSHENDKDGLWFVAERIGLDLGMVDIDIEQSYKITKIE